MNPVVPDQPARIPRNAPGLRRLIPLTEIRRFYRLLRDTLRRTETHFEIAREILRVPDRFQTLVQRSREHFELYDNRCEGFHDRCEGFHDRPCVGVLLPAAVENLKPAYQVLRHVAPSGIIIPGRAELNASFVEYALSSIRTKDSEFENGVNPMGGGGIDILLANDKDKLPVVVEVKAGTDTNPFFGLVQALTYAVELSTPAQRDRLDRIYEGRFKWPDAGPVIDIYLVLIDYPTDTSHAGFLDFVKELVQMLMLTDTYLSSLVRRIVCLKTEIKDGNPGEFRVVFCCP